MTAPKHPAQKWLLDPADQATLILVRRLTEEVLPFEGHQLHELESAVMEMNLQEGKEAIRKLRSELAEAIVEGKPLELEGDLDPPEVRVELFRSVWERGLGFLTQKEDLFANTDELIAETARRFGVSPRVIIDNLYADTPGERRVSFPGGDPGALAAEAVHAVNLLRLKRKLRRALGMSLVLPLTAKADSPYVSIFWLLKREGLMYDGVRSGSAANLSIAGPYALFERTTAYGNRLFDFCRSLFSLRGAEWTATIDVMTQAADGAAQVATIPLAASMRRLFVRQTEEPATGTTRSGDEEAFRKYFDKLSTGWSLSYEGALVPIDEPESSVHRFMVPDFVARHEASGKEVLIEIVGYWRPEYLQRKLNKITLVENRTIILLVNRRLLLGQQEAAALKEAGVQILYYERREQLKEAAREVGRMLRDSEGRKGEGHTTGSATQESG
ncbi:DUF790 family protein [bacterium]|nr:MAG: DUF790 family protein [bacterium]